MSLYEAGKHLEQIRHIVNGIEPTIQLEVGIQAANKSDLNYKVFREGQRLTDFEVFGLIPNNPEESRKAIEEAFVRYESFAKVIG